MIKSHRPDSFMAWLFEQKDRDDPIGDLARDALAHGRKPETLVELMDSMGVMACAGAIQARDDAILEFCGTNEWHLRAVYETELEETGYPEGAAAKIWRQGFYAAIRKMQGTGGKNSRMLAALYKGFENWDGNRHIALLAWCPDCRRWHHHGARHDEIKTGKAYRIMHCTDRNLEDYVIHIQGEWTQTAAAEIDGLETEEIRRRHRGLSEQPSEGCKYLSIEDIPEDIPYEA